MFPKILIANRGEIACRIIATARRMGIATVAVYSEADAAARHVAMADEAVLIGAAPARDSYLDHGRIIAAARRTGAAAIHPGYGFLSENAGFAEAVADAGIVFIGPPPAAIRAMGAKDTAKALMRGAGIPVVPGHDGPAVDDETLMRAAAGIGFPVLIKATMGGGGRGMRRVDRAEELAQAIASARREAEAAFGDGALLVEKYLNRPRHIEVQVFGDGFGNIVHLFERDCSLQRRHQKVIEEAPAPGLGAATRQRLFDAAVTAARTVGYVGAGTVEFIVESDALDRFYFMEMNTRLQVEHPVTEAVTGLDLVEWQLRVAAGGKLPLAQDQIGLCGHAIEVRISAEDPSRDFRAESGRIVDWHVPAGPGLRLDAGVGAGSEVGSHYDPLLGKLVASGKDRAEALERLRAALRQVRIAGVVTNIDLLSRIAADPAFASADVNTSFLATRGDALLSHRPVPARGWALFALAEQLRLEASMRDDPSPFAICDNWRPGGSEPMEWHFEDVDGDHVVTLARQVVRGTVEWIARWQATSMRMRLPEAGDGAIAVEIDGERLLCHSHATEGRLWLQVEGKRWHARPLGPFGRPPRRSDGERAGSGVVTASMPGRVSAILAAAGEDIAAGSVVVRLEAMKMEHNLATSMTGRVAAVLVSVGDQVNEGAELLRIEARPEPGP